MSVPPREPALRDLDEGDVGCHGDVGVVEEEDVFVSLSPRRGTLGREGTKASVMRWFEETQAPSLRSSTSGHFPDWFHRTTTRREAQDLLAAEPAGTFLLRVCENRFGFSLSVKAKSGALLHLVISQLETGKFVVIGSPKVHAHLVALLQFYSKTPINASGDVLTRSYGKAQGNAAPSNASNITAAAVPAAGAMPVVNGGSTQVGQAAQGDGRRKSKPKIARTRSHDPELGYGALDRFVNKKSQHH